jgi:fatty acid desaturase
MSMPQDSLSAPIPFANALIPQASNLTLAGLYIVLNLCQFFILPLFLLPRSMHWALLLVPLALANNPFWALIHEAIHGQFNASRAVNSAFGRILSVSFGSSFRVLRWTHLSHHKFNRTVTEQGTEVYDPQETPRLLAALKYYFQIFGGLYLLEVLTPLAFLLPRALLQQFRPSLDSDSGQREWLMRNILTDEAIQEIRIDSVTVLLLFALIVLCYREHWRLLAGASIARAFLISFLDNVYHYATPLNFKGSGYNLWLPRTVSKALLYFNLHGVHHRHPNLPWIKLPQSYAQHDERFDCNYFRAAWWQLWGPLPLPQVTKSTPIGNRPYR